MLKYCIEFIQRLKKTHEKEKEIIKKKKNIKTKPKRLAAVDKAPQINLNTTVNSGGGSLAVTNCQPRSKKNEEINVNSELKKKKKMIVKRKKKEKEKFYRLNVKRN